MKELTIREIQLMGLEILKDVHRFCIEHSIKYSLLDGSMLGAIRHQGFIPWDDDVDIIMPRPDYERFCKTYQSDDYKIKYRGNDKTCKIAFARVYDTKRTFMETTMPWCNEDVGVWIDIFPADGAYDNIDKHKSYYAKSHYYWEQSCGLRMCHGISFNLNEHDGSWTLCIKSIILNIAAKFGLVDFYIKKLIKRGKAIPFGSTHYWTQMMCMGDNSQEHNRIDTIAECTLMPFEDTQVFVMNGYEEVLRGKYNDYMQLPPVEQRVGHGSSYIHFYWKES